MQINFTIFLNSDTRPGVKSVADLQFAKTNTMLLKIFE